MGPEGGERLIPVSGGEGVTRASSGPQDGAPNCCSRLPLPGLADEPPNRFVADPSQRLTHSTSWPPLALRGRRRWTVRFRQGGGGAPQQTRLTHVPLRHPHGASWPRLARGPVSSWAASVDSAHKLLETCDIARRE